MTAPSKAVNDRPRGAGQPGERRRARRRPGPVTIAIAAAVTLLTIALMIYAWQFVWQPSAPDTSAVRGELKPSSPYATGLKVEDNGPPRKDAATGQWVVPLKAINNVMMPHRQEGTPAVATPVPAPVTVRGATVKVLLYGTTEENPERHLLGVGAGGFSSEEGLAPGQSITFEVPIAGFEDANITDYEGHADILSTDQDPVSGAAEQPPLAATPSIIPLATTTRGTTSP
ncbi:MAG: hypothetical protein M3328_13090 [Chloroflexota bacterium]|nr:hypothetical protein [Chloroflexota bacterium]